MGCPSRARRATAGESASQNASPPPVRITTRFPRSAPMSANASGSPRWAVRLQTSGPPVDVQRQLEDAVLALHGEVLLAVAIGVSNAVEPSWVRAHQPVVQPVFATMIAPLSTLLSSEVRNSFERRERVRLLGAAERRDQPAAVVSGSGASSGRMSLRLPWETSHCNAMLSRMPPTGRPSSQVWRIAPCS